MFTLINVQVWQYKSIEDSTPVELSSEVTALVGKNESGKTAFLEALNKAMPLEETKYKFDYISDYPRKDLVRYRPQHEAGKFQEVAKLAFRIEKDLAKKINDEVFSGTQIIRAFCY